MISVSSRAEHERAVAAIRKDIGRLIAALETQCPNMGLALIGHSVIGAILEHCADEEQHSGRDWVTAYLAEKLLLILDGASRVRVLMEVCSRLQLIRAALQLPSGEDEESGVCDAIETALKDLRGLPAEVDLTEQAIRTWLEKKLDAR
jgi:hypothetical protein